MIGIHLHFLFYDLQIFRKIRISQLTFGKNRLTIKMYFEEILQNRGNTMLLQFRTRNYKSFKDEMVFSLVPAPKQKGLVYSVFQTVVGKKKYKGLCSAVIYGPNAAGKTNIIGAMDSFKNIVLRGNIRNDDDRSVPNAASSALELIPNNTEANAAPVEFAVKFVSHGIVIDYSIDIDLGRFLDVDYERKVVFEQLLVNETPVFTRKDSLVIHDLSCIREWLANELEQNAESAIAIASANLNAEELFLMNGFKTIFSAKLVALITEWLSNKFMVIYRADAMQVIRKFSDPQKKSVYIEKTLNEAAETFGINSNALGYVVDGENSEAKLCSIFRSATQGKAIPAEMFESYGTIRFVNMFPLVVNALMNGGTLVVDEFDASIHPMALMNIINIFHNDEINIHHAQLIFNTHNPIFLNANLFRRDEIKFVERDEVTHCSNTYSLSDFGTSGTNGVRKNEDYMRNYFIDRYGAMKDVDFQPIFEELLRRESEESIHTE